MTDYERHLQVCRKVVEENPRLHPTAAERAEGRGHYLALIALAVEEARRQDLDASKFLLAKLVGQLVRGEVK